MQASRRHTGRSQPAEQEPAAHRSESRLHVPKVGLLGDFNGLEISRVSSDNLNNGILSEENKFQATSTFTVNLQDTYQFTLSSSRQIRIQTISHWTLLKAGQADLSGAPQKFLVLFPHKLMIKLLNNNFNLHLNLPCHHHHRVNLETFHS